MVSVWALVVWLGPLILGAVIGWSSGKSPPETSGQALAGIGKALGWSFASVFVFELAWVGMLDGFGLWSPFVWTVVTGMYWLPVTVIAYILRAAWERRGGI